MQRQRNLHDDSDAGGLALVSLTARPWGEHPKDNVSPRSWPIGAECKRAQENRDRERADKRKAMMSEMAIFRQLAPVVIRGFCFLSHAF
jgi:hypothetical protein